MKTYFITGLPRTRTAWMANFLTWGESFCHHEALLGCGSMEQFKTRIKIVPRFTNYVGNADPNLGYVAQSILDHYPTSKILFIHRPIEECVESEFHAINQDGSKELGEVTYAQLTEQFRAISRGLFYLYKSVPTNLRLRFAYDDLNRDGVIRDIWNFLLPDMLFPQARYEMLRDLRVTQMMGQVLKRHPDKPFLSLINAHAPLLAERPVECNGA